MTRYWRQTWKPRFRIWWMWNGQRATRAGLLIALVAAYAYASHLDYRDALMAAEMRAEEAERQLRELEDAKGLPPLTFLLEGKTPAEVASKLATIAGTLDEARGQITNGKTDPLPGTHKGARPGN